MILDRASARHLSSLLKKRPSEFSTALKDAVDIECASEI